MTDQELTEIYKSANGIREGKNPPISTKFIFAAMREMRRLALIENVEDNSDRLTDTDLPNLV